MKRDVIRARNTAAVCGNCPFFNRAASADDPSECRLNPPSVTPDAPRWAIVDDDDWCGSHPFVATFRCLVCGGPVLGTRPDAVFCDDLCKSRAQRRRNKGLPIGDDDQPAPPPREKA